MPIRCWSASLLGSAVALVVVLSVPLTAEPGRLATSPEPELKPGAPAWNTLALQVALDRAGFSPGEIDAAAGANTERALQSFKQARGLDDTGTLDAAAIAGLGDAFNTPVTEYVITAEDAAGPFVEAIADDMMQIAALDALSYTSVVEMLAERFHSSPALLRRLNPGAAFAAGDRLVVPNVEPFVLPGNTESTPRGPAEAAAAVHVSEAAQTVTVTTADGEVVFHAPVSIGGEQDPLPKGEWTVTGKAVLPVFHYNPDLFWDADPSHAKAKVAPGPNNPVGVVWIDLSKEHVGVHGTPEPSTIGRAQSHGCLRLTNWDAMRLAALVDRGTRVVLQ
jgi:lipoprotein-anchoring transpeptidase ErfK/SrfK